MKEIKPEKETSTLDPGEIAALLRFNITQQRVVDLCNTGGDDFHYSTYHRALDGLPTWVGITANLRHLLKAQATRPLDHMPTPPTDDLPEYLKSIAPMPTWHKALGLTFGPSGFLAWGPTRPLGASKAAEVREKVDAWYARLRDVAAIEQEHGEGRELFDREFRDGTPCLQSLVYTWIMERGMHSDEAHERFLKVYWVQKFSPLTTIDLLDPKVVTRPFDATDDYWQRFILPEAEERWKQIIISEMRGARPGVPPHGMTYAVETERVWPDARFDKARDQSDPYNLNQELYGKRYRVREFMRWEPNGRFYILDRQEVTEVFDGDWREANQREKQGWDEGTRFFIANVERAARGVPLLDGDRGEY